MNRDCAPITKRRPSIKRDSRDSNKEKPGRPSLFLEKKTGMNSAFIFNPLIDMEVRWKEHPRRCQGSVLQQVIQFKKPDVGLDLDAVSVELEL